MASVNTNAAAITALRTLQQTNASLDKTQNRISTGYKIGEAKDNAAYWAISVALKSDNKALSTVKDALGLGAATVDTAYQGLNKAKDVLDEIKSKLTAATQAGVDKTKIQAEISELQKQLSSIASASTFSGENWLSFNSGTANFNTQKTVVSSFVRDGNNAVSIGTINIDVSTIGLYDSAEGKDGILDKRVALGNLTVGGLPAAGAAGNTDDAGLKNFATPGTQGSASFTVTPITDTTDGGESLSFKVFLDGSTTGATVTLTAADLLAIKGAGVTADLQGAELATRLTTHLSGVAATATYDTATDKLTITSNTKGGASAVVLKTTTDAAISGVVGVDDNSGTDDNYNDNLGLSAAVSAAPPAAVLTFDAFGGSAVTLDGDDALTFEVSVDGGASKSVRIDKSVVNSAIAGETNGEISDLDDMVLVMRKALANAGITATSLTVGKNAGNTAVTLTSATVGGTSNVTVAGLAVANSASTMSVNEIDITKLDTLGATTGAQQKAVLEAYISVVNQAINNVSSSAALLGAAASRIDLQKTFVDTLMDTIDKGVGNLVDADMSEESTKLQALQVKQQLGVQALSIANQSAQNILALFQSGR